MGDNQEGFDDFMEWLNSINERFEKMEESNHIYNINSILIDLDIKPIK
tara:strand:- start:6688 stop:6831 length:144 start_codon:yes stop_codon:yes gene_type:complete